MTTQQSAKLKPMPAAKAAAQPTSPWTEVFQAQAAAQQLARQQSAHRTPARPSDADAVMPTRDALSVIFKQD